MLLPFDIRTDCQYNVFMGRKINSVWLNESVVRDAFQDAESMKEILVRLRQPLGSGNYLALKRAARWYGLEIPKFTNVQRTTSAKEHNTIPLQDILIEHSTYTNRQALKKRLISELGWVDQCGAPGCPSPWPTWNGKPLVLQLEHINGIGDDNRLSNLMFICPNCHTQTKTFGNKNPYRNSKRYYCRCGLEKWKYAETCMRCAGQKRNKVDWPPVDEVVALVNRTNYVNAGRVLGCSDNAVRKFLKREGAK